MHARRACLSTLLLAAEFNIISARVFAGSARAGAGGRTVSARAERGEQMKVGLNVAATPHRWRGHQHRAQATPLRAARDASCQTDVAVTRSLTVGSRDGVAHEEVGGPTRFGPPRPRRRLRRPHAGHPDAMHREVPGERAGWSFAELLHALSWVGPSLARPVRLLFSWGLRTSDSLSRTASPGSGALQTFGNGCGVPERGGQFPSQPWWHIVYAFGIGLRGEIQRC